MQDANGFSPFPLKTLFPLSKTGLVICCCASQSYSTAELSFLCIMLVYTPNTFIAHFFQSITPPRVVFHNQQCHDVKHCKAKALHTNLHGRKHNALIWRNWRTPGFLQSITAAECAHNKQSKGAEFLQIYSLIQMLTAENTYFLSS